MTKQLIPEIYPEVPPKVFLKAFPFISRQQYAALLGYDVGTINSYFCKPYPKSTPGKRGRRREVPTIVKRYTGRIALDLIASGITPIDSEINQYLYRVPK
ncbi:hypothetical protein IQ264_08240 [Phormidium sp. LEGE 05292]|uniref:hypothetical protein n=1 Tax=[Phormidium] sp. LEGE 05292 TaxID=767427 RepID=UPI0018805780|nr:hypothetical protein [Phormidium sp. LEGE 05292]MBE9225419.1 hypothetical protein [Phormidium sp. LEGE 05292]